MEDILPDLNSFTTDLSNANIRVRALMDRHANTGNRPNKLLDETILELQAELEELQVAHEELRIQNENLQMAAMELAQERRRYQHLFDSASDIYLTTDAMGVILEANRVAGAVLGVSPSFLVGKPLASFIPTAHRLAFRKQINRFRSANSDLVGETVLIPRKASKGIPFSFHAAADDLVYQSGAEIRWLFRSMKTSAPPAEVEVEPTSPRQGPQLQPFLASCQTLLHTDDTIKLLTTLAQLLSDKLGDYTFISLLEPNGKLLKPVAGGSRRPEYLAMISQFLQADAQPVEGHVGKKVLQSEQPLVITVGEKGKSASSNGGSKADRTGGAMNMLMLPLRATGKPLGLVAVIRDPSHPPFSRDEVTIAESLTTHATLVYLVSQHLRQEAESAWLNAGRGSFLSDLLADLQAPLHAMSGYISLIQEQAAENQLTDISTDSEVMARALRDCNTTLEDLAEIVRIEQCLVKPTIERLTVQELLQDIASTVFDKTERNKISVEIPRELKTTVVSTDLVRFRLALGRVLASVCTRANHCRLTCETREDVVSFNVHCATKIFGPAVFLQLFNQELPESTTARPFRGAGTSLILAQRITRLLKGTFSIDVSADHETIVKMALPLY